MSQANKQTQTAGPTPEQVQALADAMEQLLDDMHMSGGNACLLAQAQARVAYEPWVEAEDAATAYMDLAEAREIVSNVR